jgi:hypothetical protein
MVWPGLKGGMVWPGNEIGQLRAKYVESGK